MVRRRTLRTERRGAVAREGLTPPHTLIPIPEPRFHRGLDPSYPLSPTVLIGMEEYGGTLRWGEPAEGLQVQAVGGGPNGGEPGGCLATPQLSVDLEEAAQS